MKKIVIVVLGYDRPGIIAGVSRILFSQGYNIEDVSQTILQTEFVGVFIASAQERASEELLLAELRAMLAPMGLLVNIKPMEEAGEWRQPPSEPFVITTVGPDRPGLVAGITDLLARYGVNITNLKAVSKGSRTVRHYIMVYEVDIPLSIDQKTFREALHDRALELGLDVNMQHRAIFEQIHRV